MIEFDENYWVKPSPVEDVTRIGQEVARKVVNGKVARVVTTSIDANSIAEQLIAGFTLLAVGAAGAHVYDQWKQGKRRGH